MQPCHTRALVEELDWRIKLQLVVDFQAKDSRRRGLVDRGLADCSCMHRIKSTHSLWQAACDDMNDLCPLRMAVYAGSSHAGYRQRPLRLPGK